MNLASFIKPDYSAHPMLDPHYLDHDPMSARVLARSYLAMSKSEEDYNVHLNRLLNPMDRRRSLAENLETARRYLVDVNGYMREVLTLLRSEVRKPLAMDAEVAARNEVQGLLDLAFRGESARVRFEAQRKLYLAKLFFDIDHDPGIQMGPVHKDYFEQVLDRAFWSQSTRAKPVDMYYELAEDGVHININTKQTGPNQEKWAFHLTPIRRPGRRPIHVYHYACRFKREVAPFRYRRGEEEYQIQEKPIWETLHERRSGSVLSKMIRKGIVHPRKIQDIIGAMFIVKDLREVEALQEALFGVFGGPLNWKDRVNTIRFPEDRTRLNIHSGRGFEVLKSDVDVLFSPPDNGHKPYIFSVEIQIYTVEGFLRTIHSRHYASHQNLKVRQFLEALLPYLFPIEVYGEDLIQRCMDSLDQAAEVLQPVEGM
jgi:hypothetical protein